jgi:hypothetical protein
MTHHRLDLSAMPLTCWCGEPWVWIHNAAGGYCLAEDTAHGAVWELRQCVLDLALTFPIPARLRSTLEARR